MCLQAPFINRFLQFIRKHCIVKNERNILDGMIPEQNLKLILFLILQDIKNVYDIMPSNDKTSGKVLCNDLGMIP